jgi:G:T/U-mismatch repair DNA glycosylase
MLRRARTISADSFSSIRASARVFFNGRKAEASYRRLVLPELSLRMLPSTSPAHAGMTFAAKLSKCRTIKEVTA